MFAFRTVTVIPRLPREINRLRELAYNLYFSWNDCAVALFKSINPDLWEEVYHNPVQFLLQVDESDLKRAAASENFLSQYRQAIDSFDIYMQQETWYDKNKVKFSGAGQNQQDGLIAYFSAEFGLHESYPTYSGGLGLLAGDHCKAASDLGLPFVGVGLLYKHGYFTQLINQEGRQEAHYRYQNFSALPITPALDGSGRELLVAVELPGRQVHARVWQIQVGRVTIYFLDADLPVNSREDRELTGQLYGGDQETRIGQEILLGMGGVRALRALGYAPTVWHINEGHAAFLLVERLREFVEDKGLPVGAALEALRADTLFTTHTPVPAGHDIFNPEMIDRYFGYLYPRLGLNREQFLQLAHDQDRGGFNMTLLALKQCGFCNGVSRLHGEVTRSMFHTLYPDIPLEEVPIGHVTNGVHTLTWLAPEMRKLFNKYLGESWRRCVSDLPDWERVENIPGRELWEVHMSLKEKMVQFARRHLVQQRVRNHETLDRIKEVENYLRPEVLTIGFARRFATYKRAGLLFRDKDRLAALVNDQKRPVQFIFAGKAHPADKPGQELIKLINDVAADERFRGKVVFLENYDINISRYLLQGVDVWLNTPRRPLEASGTSGMKAAVNGVLNCSVLDGWWPEAYNGRNGFAVGEDWDFPSDDARDQHDYYSLFALLEKVIIPAYYEQTVGVPRKWAEWMKESIKTITPYFSTQRMVLEYTQKYYLKAHERSRLLSSRSYQVCHDLYRLKNFLRENWHHVKISGVETSGAESMHPEEKLTVRATVELGPVPRDNVCVEIVYGEVAVRGLKGIKAIPLSEASVAGETDRVVYAGDISLPQGTFGYTVRVRPHSPHFAHHFELPLVCWTSSL
ncbi:alpha-glucan family phosphorylase [Desulfallas thermosapovorans]|uniref:Maltodextrin phosphorylase n=1 Tax=Desulfallas thermosapovorans DSM 6562 TaxID=1121431 RepID=A0A5S4ZP93_9FIRM|nr:alpha-glucan family phosphorylase [Desulfallas thermosapovorans]TYO93886.1 maltodextrin phosphorylase [Desulfallas thermosapovorans DSM 6562]